MAAAFFWTLRDIRALTWSDIVQRWRPMAKAINEQRAKPQPVFFAKGG